MTINKTHAIIASVFFAIGALCGFFLGKSMYQPTYGEKVERDTVLVHDTVPDIAPAPKDSVRTKWVTRWLPRDTSSRVDHFIEANNMDHYADTSKMIAVEVPITSKHYGSKDYDAWVSGYEPSLDSIKVYQRTEYITERVTISKPPNKWELDAMAGIDYNVTSQHYSPYAGGELLYKPNRLQVGIRGGVVKGGNKAESFAGAVIKYRLF